MKNYSICQNQFSSNNYDEFCELYTIASVEEKILEEGSFNGEVKIIKSAHVMLNSFKINRKVLQTGTGVKGYITFAIYKPETTFTWKNHTMGKGKVGILWKREHQSITGAGFIGIPISVDENFFIERCGLKGCSHLMALLSKNDVLCVNESKLAELRNMILWINANSNLPDIILYDLLENQLVDLLIQVLNTDFKDKTSKDLTFNKFSNLIEYIHHDVANITSLSQISINTKIPERTIRRLIRKKYDIAPKKYINALRLNEVRKRIKTNDEGLNIFKIASEFNYWHMGQFSQDYKNLFGELPSETKLNS